MDRCVYQGREHENSFHVLKVTTVQNKHLPALCTQTNARLVSFVELAREKLLKRATIVHKRITVHLAVVFTTTKQIIWTILIGAEMLPLAVL